MIVLRVLAVALMTLTVVMLNLLVVMYMERKVLAHLQSRLGPMRTGWHGLLQPIADAVKLLAKEDVTPAGADKLIFRFAPVLTFVPSFFLYAAMPWVQDYIGMDLDVGLFFVFAVAALITVGLLVGGWASASKYALLGAFRAAAQQISYEVPLLMSVEGVALLANSLRLGTVIDAQKGMWFIWLQPLAFVLYLVTILAELNRTPFDMPEAESELVAGFNVEYSSMRFALFFLAEYGNMFTYSLLGAMLFLGGWNGPFLPGWVWLGLKCYLLVFLFIWARATLPRIRVDQLMAFGWKLLLPVALANLVITGAGMATGSMLLMVVLEVIGLVAFVLIIAAVARKWTWRGSRAHARA
jgi:NADH-quinone oxidoreductase subunit H